MANGSEQTEPDISAELQAKQLEAQKNIESLQKNLEQERQAFNRDLGRLKGESRKNLKESFKERQRSINEAIERERLRAGGKFEEAEILGLRQTAELKRQQAIAKAREQAERQPVREKPTTPIVIGKEFFRDARGRIIERATGRVVQESLTFKESRAEGVPAGRPVQVTRTPELTTFEEKKVQIPETKIEREAVAATTQVRTEALVSAANEGNRVAQRALKILGVDQKTGERVRGEVNIVSTKSDEFGRQIAVDEKGKEYVVIPSKEFGDILVDKKDLDMFQKEELKRLQEAQRFEKLSGSERAIRQFTEAIPLGIDRLIEKAGEFAARPKIEPKELLRPKIFPDQEKEIKKAAGKVVKFFRETAPKETRERAVFTLAAEKRLEEAGGFPRAFFKPEGQAAFFEAASPKISTIAVVTAPFTFGASGAAAAGIRTAGSKPVIQLISKALGRSLDVGVSGFVIAGAVREPTPLNIALAAIPFSRFLPKPRLFKIAKGFAAARAAPKPISAIVAEEKRRIIVTEIGRREAKVQIPQEVSPKGAVSKRQDIIIRAGVERGTRLRQEPSAIDRFLSRVSGQPQAAIFQGVKFGIARRALTTPAIELPEIFRPLTRTTIGRRVELPVSKTDLFAPRFEVRRVPAIAPVRFFGGAKFPVPFVKLKFREAKPFTLVERAGAETLILGAAPQVSGARSGVTAFIRRRAFGRGEAFETVAVRARLKDGTKTVGIRFYDAFILRPSGRFVKPENLQKIIAEAKDTVVRFREPPTPSDIIKLTDLERRGAVQIIRRKIPTEVKGVLQESAEIEGFRVTGKPFTLQEVAEAGIKNVVAGTFKLRGRLGQKAVRLREAKFENLGIRKSDILREVEAAKRAELVGVRFAGAVETISPRLIIRSGKTVSSGVREFVVSDTRYQRLFEKARGELQRVEVPPRQLKAGMFRLTATDLKRTLTQVGLEKRKIFRTFDITKEFEAPIDVKFAIARQQRFTPPLQKEARFLRRRGREDLIVPSEDVLKRLEIFERARIPVLARVEKRIPIKPFERIPKEAGIKEVIAGRGTKQLVKQLSENVPILRLPTQKLTEPRKMVAPSKVGFRVGRVSEQPSIVAPVKPSEKETPKIEGVTKPVTKPKASVRSLPIVRAVPKAEAKPSVKARPDVSTRVQPAVKPATSIREIVQPKVQPSLRPAIRITQKIIPKLAITPRITITTTTVPPPPPPPTQKHKIIKVPKKPSEELRIVNVAELGKKKRRLIPDLLSQFQSKLLFKGKATAPPTTFARFVKAAKTAGFRVRTVELERQPSLTFGIKAVKGRGLIFGIRERLGRI